MKKSLSILLLLALLLSLNGCGAEVQPLTLPQTEPIVTEATLPPETEPAEQITIPNLLGQQVQKPCAEEIVVAEHNAADILGMEGVYILFGADGVNDLFFRNVLGERELYEYAVDGGIGIQFFKQNEQFALFGLCGETVDL